MPIYTSLYHAQATSDVISIVWGLHAIMCFVISESLLERDDVVSEDVMGVINIESSSGNLVEIEKDEDLKLGKIRSFKISSFIVVALPSIVGLASIFYAQTIPGPTPSFNIITP